MSLIPMHYIIHTDGGARGNPGPAAIGVVIDSETDGKVSHIAKYGTAIGNATNNVAEYQAVVSALEKVHALNQSVQNGNTFDIYIDSTLIVNQLNGLFKVKDATLRNFLTTIRMLEQQVGGEIRYHHIPREQNTDADQEVNSALDSLIYS